MWRYDVERLRVYAESRPGLPIEVRESAGLLALRFDDVGYFNRAIGSVEALRSGRDELLEFYGGGGLPFRVSVGFGETGSSPLIGGFAPGAVEEYLVRETAGAELEVSAGWSFEPLRPGDEGAFFSMYLQLFSGETCREEEALRNMVQLVRLEGLRCCWGLYEGERAGIGMWHRQGRLACLCAGAILPEMRGQGGHGAMVRHRLEEARKVGCDTAVAVAKESSDSAKNLRGAGFRLVWRDEALYWPGRSPMGEPQGPGAEGGMPAFE